MDWLLVGGGALLLLSAFGKKAPTGAKSLATMSPEEKAALEQQNVEYNKSLPPLVAGASREWVNNLALPTKAEVNSKYNQGVWGQQDITLEEVRAAQEEARKAGLPEGYYLRQLPMTCQVKWNDRIVYTACNPVIPVDKDGNLQGLFYGGR